jgi:Ion channel
MKNNAPSSPEPPLLERSTAAIRPQHEDSTTSHVWSSTDDEHEDTADPENDVAAALNISVQSQQDDDNAIVADGIMKRCSPHTTTKKKRIIHLPRLRVRRKHRMYEGAARSFTSSDEDDDDKHRDKLADDTADGDDDPSVTGNWSIDEQEQNNRTPVVLTEHDIAMCQALDLEYERALEDRQVAWTARYQSVRQSTLFSVLFMVLLIVTGTTFFLHQADAYWSISEGLLFTIYTATTVGYGHLDMPDTPIFQIYTSCFIFLGIAMLTILVAQVYQCVALEASRVAVTAGDAQTARRNSMRLWLEARMQEQRAESTQRQQQQQQTLQASGGEQTTTTTTTTEFDENNSSSVYPFDHAQSFWDWADIAEWLLHGWDATRNFLRDNEFGRGLSVVLPFVGLIAIGAGVIGPLEGWTAVESIYFAVVSLSTVGFGDYYPTRTASIWFCCLWLPFSVVFMSLYLANVAAFYIRLSDRNVARIERILRRRLQRAKERAELERSAVLRRAMRGQFRRETSHVSGYSSDDELALAAEAAEAAQRPLNVEEGVTVVTVNRSGNKGLRQTANRRRGFDTIPSMEDSNHDRAANPDGTVSDSDNQQNGQEGSNASSHLFGTEGSASHRRERILHNSLKHMRFAPKDEGKGQRQRAAMTMTTMHDVLRTVHRNNSLEASAYNQDHSGHGSGVNGTSNISPRLNFQAAAPGSEFLSVKSSRTVLHSDQMTVRKKPSFALRALVQERFAEIIATDIAGYQSSIEIKEYTLSVTIQSLKQTADKWLVPRRARKAFRAVAFEALYFVGEHGLITRGAQALFSLTPFEFHQIFSPLLAAFGDAETMELWLEHTQALADVDLVPSDQQRTVKPGSRTDLKLASLKSNSQRLRSDEGSNVEEVNGGLVAKSTHFAAAKLIASASLSTSPKEKELPDLS